MKHDDLQESLACHLRGNTDRMVWTNTQLGPSGSPRPDVFTVDKSYARFRTDCYECKVSVSDLRHDVTSGKWQSYRKFGHAVWFAFPRGMAPLDLVPKECGIILLGDAWRAARKPVAQVLDTLPRDAWLKLLMTPPEGGEASQPRSHWTAQQAARKRVGGELAELLSKREQARHRFESATQRLEDAAAEARKTREQMIEDARRVADQAAFDLTRAQRELGMALGLPEEDITPAKLTSALHDARRALQSYGLEQAIKSMQRLKSLMDGEVPA